MRQRERELREETCRCGLRQAAIKKKTKKKHYLNKVTIFFRDKVTADKDRAIGNRDATWVLRFDGTIERNAGGRLSRPKVGVGKVEVPRQKIICLPVKPGCEWASTTKGSSGRQAIG